VRYNTTYTLDESVQDPFKVVYRKCGRGELCVMEAKIHVRQHRKTGLLMAMTDDLPGFFVHAHDEDELFAKLGPAIESFMNKTGRPVMKVEVVRESEDYWPPEFVARAAMRSEAA
jgi:hypothetical protein